MERDAATGAKRRPRAPAKESEEAAAPSLAGTGAAAGEPAANLETAAALHAMARTLLLPPTASEHAARREAGCWAAGRLCHEDEPVCCC